MRDRVVCLIAGLGLGLGLAACGGASEDVPEPVKSCAPPPAPGMGEATHYAADGTGNCSFAATDDRMVAALNGADYANAAWCGGCIAVSGPDGEVVVKIVDQCPGCAKGDVDLSREAFAKIAPISAGRVPITWRQVACEVEGPIDYHFKDRSNEFWAAVQIRHHRYPIAKLEARDAAGTYKGIQRQGYNYFVAPSGSLGAGPFTFRVTDARGQMLEDRDVVLGADVTRSGAAQFASCPLHP